MSKAARCPSSPIQCSRNYLGNQWSCSSSISIGVGNERWSHSFKSISASIKRRKRSRRSNKWIFRTRPHFSCQEVSRSLTMRKTRQICWIRRQKESLPSITFRSYRLASTAKYNQISRWSGLIVLSRVRRSKTIKTAPSVQPLPRMKVTKQSGQSQSRSWPIP